MKIPTTKIVYFVWLLISLSLELAFLGGQLSAWAADEPVRLSSAAVESDAEPGEIVDFRWAQAVVGTKVVNLSSVNTACPAPERYCGRLRVPEFNDGPSVFVSYHTSAINPNCDGSPMGCPGIVGSLKQAQLAIGPALLTAEELAVLEESDQVARREFARQRFAVSLAWVSNTVRVTSARCQANRFSAENDFFASDSDESCEQTEVRRRRILILERR